MNNKIMAILLTIFITGSLVALAGCNAKQGATGQNQMATVQRGNIVIDITGAGNLSLSKTEDLAFEIAGYVQEVMVKEGESVKEGQVLAQIDTTEWEKQLKTLQKTLDTAQRGLTSAQNNVIKAQRSVTNLQANATKAERNLNSVQDSVTKAEGQVTSKEFALRQTQLDLESAKYNLSQIQEVKYAQTTVDNAQSALDVAKATLKVAQVEHTSDPETNPDIAYFESVLAKAQQKLQDILQGKSLNISTTVALQVAQYELRIEQSQKAVADAQTAIEDAKTAVEDAQLDVEDAKTAIADAQLDVEDAKNSVNNALLDQANAEQNVKDAQGELDTAKNLSPLVKAPFAGFITKVNVSGGDEVQKGTVAMQLADPAKFTADIIVNENDITRVKEGGGATVQVDPIAGLVLPALVTHVSPTATVQSGVVSYKVTVEMQNQPSPMPSFTPSPSPQADTTAGPSAPNPSRTPGQSFPGRGAFPGLSRSGASPAQTSQIMAGMSVTVSITVAESRNVLVVPNQAITYSGRTSTVQVMKDGKAETRTLKTGINNWQFTEVTEGLSEGEQVIIPTASPLSSVRPTAAPRQGQPQAPIVIPGGGRLR